MTARAYYNENNAFCAAWLRNLISAGHIAHGDVDDRSILDVRPSDLTGYTQLHWFAGIGGWSLALRIAGWPDEREIWTGSPPCQDVSVAGAIWNVRRGLQGDRTSLAFQWIHLLGHLRPSMAAFENVSGIKPWIAQIEGCLEGFGYVVTGTERSTADLAGPHRRRRVWRIAHRDGERLEKPGPAGSREAICDPRGTPPGNVWSPAPHRSCRVDDGFSARLDGIRAFGNAIDPWVAASVIQDFAMDGGPRA